MDGEVAAGVLLPATDLQQPIAGTLEFGQKPARTRQKPPTWG
jgi:hypothetical protein